MGTFNSVKAYTINWTSQEGSSIFQKLLQCPDPTVTKGLWGWARGGRKRMQRKQKAKNKYKESKTDVELLSYPTPQRRETKYDDQVKKHFL